MIPDYHANTVYFFNLIKTDAKYTQCFRRIEEVLKKHDINYHFLSGTKDIWCRDYMPIQLSKNEFVQFKYEPSYLADDLNLQTNPQTVLKSLGINPKTSTINVDGGNVVKWQNEAILTYRVFDENNLDTEILIEQLTNELKAELDFVPAITNDMTGHSDGHLRFINNNSILVNELTHELLY